MLGGVVKGRQPAAQPPDEEHRRREAQHQKRVSGSESVDEPFAWSLEFLRRLDQPDDFLECALPGQTAHDDLNRAPEVQRAAEDRFARALLHGLGLPSEGGFVARGLAADDVSIGREHLARLHEHAIADDHFFDRHQLLAAVRPQDRGLLGRSL